jgi:hypothetical protein
MPGKVAALLAEHATTAWPRLAGETPAGQMLHG